MHEKLSDFRLISGLNLQKFKCLKVHIHQETKPKDRVEASLERTILISKKSYISTLTLAEKNNNRKVLLCDRIYLFYKSLKSIKYFLGNCLLEPTDFQSQLISNQVLQES